MQIISFDTETEMMSYLNPIPDLICLTHSIAGELKGSLLTPWEKEIDKLVAGWFNSDQHTTGHNIAFDLSILAFKYPHLMPCIFKALDNGQIHDNMLREKLLNITRHGALDMIEANGIVMRVNYAQLDLEKRYLNLDRSELKKDDDAPRTNYAVYKNVPANQWAEEYISYAVDDAINAGLIYNAQENERAKCIEITGYDPFKTEIYKVKAAFALRLIECVGSCLDPVKVKEVSESFEKEYNKPSLRQPLLDAGLLLDAVPPQPYAKGTLDHLITCKGHKDHPEYKKSAKVKDCGCPVKMKAGESEKSPTKPLFQYIWSLARKNPEIKAWPADAYISKMKQEGLYDQLILDGAFRQSIINQFEEMPEDITLCTDSEWQENFAALDPLLVLWAERKNLRKIVTDYLPKMQYTDEATGISIPAEIIRSGYSPLMLTGRSSSFASKLYPSRNGQNVDPRIRPCTIPRPGNIICSTDYNGMELGTLAEKCFQLFGFSELANKINAGIDTHAFLGGQIAHAMDNTFNALCNSDNTDYIYEVFKTTETFKEPCESETFNSIYKYLHPDLDRPVLWSDFFKHYRTLAKPTGLGYPGGLGPATFISFAKATYGITIDLKIAEQLRDLWLSTYPEMGMYLDWVSKQCRENDHAPELFIDDDGKEKKKVYYAYDTPYGMHRAKCGFCEAANGAALQAFAAEGALPGLYEVQKAVWLASETNYPELMGVMIIEFIHDEILWEQPDDALKGRRARIIESIMVEQMRKVTPHVVAGATTAAMRRWYKEAKSIWIGEELVVWEPEQKG